MGDGSGQSATGLLAYPPGPPLDKQAVRLPAAYPGPGPASIAPDHAGSFRAPFPAPGIRFPAMVPAP